MQKYLDLDSFTAVGAGEIANLVLAPGVRYDEIHLETNKPEKVEWVRLKLNGREVFDLSKAELDMLSDHDKIKRTTGYIELPLALIGAVLLDSQLTTGLETGKGDNVVLEVKFASDAGTPTLKAFANTSAHAGRRDVVRTFKRYTIPVTANGEVDFTSLVKGGRVMRMFFKSEHIAKLEIKQNDRVVYELTSERNDYLLERAGKALVNGYYVFNAIKRDYPMLDAMNTEYLNLNFKLTIEGQTNAQNVPVLVEQYENLEPRDWRG